MSNRKAKGQVFFKFLWQLEQYQTKGGVSPRLAEDLKTIAVNQTGINPDSVITNKRVFNWINGSIIPAWACKSAFLLALRYHWQPVDLTDVETVIFLVAKECQSESVTVITDHCLQHYNVKFPKALLAKL